VTTLTFTVTFHSPFLSATGVAANGFDATVDPHDPLRESTLKGAMSASAETVLGLSHSRRSALFGTTASEGQWRWIVHRSNTEIATDSRHRVAINDDTHTARQDMLVRAQVGLPQPVSFEVWRAGACDDETLADEQLALTAAAHSLHRLGGQTSRGLGWVGVTGGVTLGDDQIARLLAWASEADS